MGGLLTFIRPSHRDNGNKNRDSGESIGSGSESTQSADDVPFAINGVLEEIARYVNLAELKHTFVEEGLLEDEDLAVDLGAPFREFSKQKDRLTYLKRIFVDKRKFEQFRRCIEKIFQKPGGHLGHDYIYTLLYSTKSKFAQESSIRMSQILHERIERNVYTLIRCIKPSLLYQQMFQKRLLTEAEFERLNNSNLTDMESNERVFALLKTKGPTAHLLFTQCLSKTGESYECHREVITLLNLSDADECISPEQPLTLIQVPSYLKGKHYHERRKRFEACYHNGNWAALEEESRKCTDSNIPEIMAIGYLELALGWIFQLNQTEVKKNLKLAHHVITTMVKNPAILYARHEYLHALLLRYLKQYPEASKKAESAMMILTLFDVGEDKAFAQYCYATSFVETLTPWCSDEEFCKAQTMLVTAIDYSRKAVDMEILVTYSQLQLTRLHLGTTDSFLTVTKNQSRIERSHQCLAELGRKLRRNELHNVRFESLYYLRLSDYERCRGDMTSAEQSALKAKELAVKASLPIETTAADNRIEYVRQCTFSMGSRDTGQKRENSAALNSDSMDPSPPVKRNRTQSTCT